MREDYKNVAVSLNLCDRDKLDIMCNTLKKNKSKILRAALKRYYLYLKKKGKIIDKKDLENEYII